MTHDVVRRREQLYDVLLRTLGDVELTRVDVDRYERVDVDDVVIDDQYDVVEDNIERVDDEELDQYDVVEEEYVGQEVLKRANLPSGWKRL